MTITHIFFELNNVLVDSRQMPACYAHHLGQVMAARYGGQPEAWTNAHLRIRDDWDSYFADLDLDGDEGLADMWEGELRVTRALFRLTHTPEPDLSTLTALSRELPYLATRNCNTLYPDIKPVIEKLHAAGFILGVATHATTAQARGTLEGGEVIDQFAGTFLCPDFTEHFSKNRDFFLAAPLTPENCLVVDHSLDGIRGAKAAGMWAVQVVRKGIPPTDSPADHLLTGDLYGLLDYLGISP